MANSPDSLTAASQLAAILAQQSGPGFSKDPADYQLPWVKFSGREFNPADPRPKPEIDPDRGFLIGDNIIDPEGVLVIIVGSTSGWEEKDRVIVEGREEKRRFAIWKTKPDVMPVTGKGGGLRTDRGGWLTGRIDEIFLLTPYGLAITTLYDGHHVVGWLNRRAQALGASAMYDIKWRLTKVEVTDGGGYTHAEPHFEALRLAGEPDGPTDQENAQAKRLSAQIARISYAAPGVPLRLVVNGPTGEPLADDEPPAPDADDPGPRPNDDDLDIPF